jgi:hypothetical protein
MGLIEFRLYRVGSIGRTGSQRLALIAVTLWLAGCSTEAAYEGMKRGAEHACYQHPPSETERCLARLNKKTYEEYEKERTHPKK